MKTFHAEEFVKLDGVHMVYYFGESSSTTKKELVLIKPGIVVNVVCVRCLCLHVVNSRTKILGIPKYCCQDQFQSGLNGSSSVSMHPVLHHTSWPFPWISTGHTHVWKMYAKVPKLFKELGVNSLDVHNCTVK